MDFFKKFLKTSYLRHFCGSKWTVGNPWVFRTVLNDIIRGHLILLLYLVTYSDGDWSTRRPKHPNMNKITWFLLSDAPHKVADLHICATIEPLHRRMVHHRRANSSGQDSAVNLHLKDEGLSSEWQKCSCFGQRTMMIWKGKYGISTQLFRTEETSRISGETNKTK